MKIEISVLHSLCKFLDPEESGELTETPYVDGARHIRKVFFSHPSFSKVSFFAPLSATWTVQELPNRAFVFRFVKERAEEPNGPGLRFRHD